MQYLEVEIEHDGRHDAEGAGRYVDGVLGGIHHPVHGVVVLIFVKHISKQG
jgi:hypothetical protein